MEIQKEAQARSGGRPAAGQMAAIHNLTKAALTEEEVYVFSLRLCDDQIDRDYERFDTDALPELARLFVGKTGVLDHQWSSECQVARIFQTEVVREEGVSYLKAWAYIPRGGAGDALIGDIESGIKKEVSVGCAMGRRVCSICGSEAGSCGHQKGEVYDGHLCHTILREPLDAYEFSFVAVPAQREAGVLKSGSRRASLKDLAARYGAQGEYQTLEKQAELGRAYLRQTQEDVVRLCLGLDVGLTEPVLRGIAEKIGAGELLLLKEALEDRLSRRLPLKSQFPAAPKMQEEVESGFLI